MSTAFFQGMAVGGGLIVAIGAQNVFVLTQGVRRNHHLAVAGLCMFCDAVLIALGVAGIGSVVAASPFLGGLATWGGAAFLFWYGLKALWSALGTSGLQTREPSACSLGRVLGLTLAVTLLNPHVYLDTVVLMGSISGRFPLPDRYFFGLGAMTASILWFSGLCIGGRMLAPLFRAPLTWKILDGLVCLTMWAIAFTLLRSTLPG